MTIVQLGNTSFRSARHGSAKTMKSCSTSYHHLPSMATSKTSRAHCHGKASSFFGRHVASQICWEVRNVGSADISRHHSWKRLKRASRCQMPRRILQISPGQARPRIWRDWAAQPGGPRSDIRNLEFCKTRPWPDHDLSGPFQALYLYPHEYDEHVSWKTTLPFPRFAAQR